MRARRRVTMIYFPYKQYRQGAAPIVPLSVLADHRWRTVWTYVDSGAAYSLLSIKDAKRLGLMRVKGRRLAVTTSGGVTQQISLHRLWVKFGGQKLSITFGVPRGFDVDFNLLGRRDFFGKYRVCFDDLNQIVTFTPHIKVRR